MKRGLFIFLMVAMVAFSGCHRAQVIPRKTLSKIYAEMFIADQQILNTPKMRSVADTMLVYEPIFNRYGYTADDYRASMSYYLKDATRYARILKHTSVIIEQEVKALKKEQIALAKLQNEKNDALMLIPERVFYLTAIGNPDIFGTDSLSFFVDSTGGVFAFDPRLWADTAYFGPEMVLLEDKIVEAPADTTAVAAITEEIIEAEAVAEKPAAEKPAEKPNKPVTKKAPVEKSINEKDSSKVPVHTPKPLPDSIRVRRGR